MNRSFVWGVPSAAIAVLALIVSLNTASRPAGGTAAEITGSAGPLSVKLSEFTIDPATLTAASGRAVSIEAENVGAVEHNLAIAGVARIEMVSPTKKGVLQLPALDPGTYELICEVAGHAQAGMTATLEVKADGGAAAAGTPAAVAPSAMTPEQMDDAYMAGIKAFLGEKPPSGARPMQPKIVGGVKVFELTAEEIDWEPAPGEKRKAMAYNRQIPGPQIRAKLGERVRIVLHNRLKESSSIHFHGLEVPNDQDGVPGLTEEIVKPGADRTYEFDVPNSGTHLYHAHMDSQKQVPLGLLGPFIVDGPNEPAVDAEHSMVLNDGPLGFTINGRGFPWTAAIAAKPGQTLRIRYMNEGLQGHPMHLHGLSQQIIAIDGWPVPAPWRQDTVWVSPGQRIDVLVTARPGLWAFHCHILNHAENEAGYTGMTTVMAVA